MPEQSAGQGDAVLASVEALCEDEMNHVEVFDAVYKSAEKCATGRCSHEYDYECGSDAVMVFVQGMRKAGDVANDLIKTQGGDRW